MSVSPGLIADLKRDEGLRLKAYPDPLTRADPWTCGYGHTGADVCEDTVWTQEQCEAALIADVEEVQRQLDAKLPWWRTLDPVRQDAVCNMAFNLGVAKLLTFSNTLAALKARDYRRAAASVMASRWAVQVGARSTRIAQMIVTGRRIP